MKPNEMTNLCKVCDGSAKGIHFGVQVCRACSAFFRRTVAKNRKYTCAHESVCEIASSIRSMCRSCRYSKCLAVGMNTNAVQKYRDFYGKRTSSTASLAFETLDSMMQNYCHLEKVRQVIHRSESEIFTQKHTPRALNYRETVDVLLREFRLVENLFSHSFSDFASLEEDQKKVLFRNFYLQFVLLEGGHFACVRGRSDITFLPSGDFIDCVHPETYYYDPDGLQPISAADAAKMFASSFATYRRNVYYPMLRDQVDRFEFLALAALALFDTGLDGQSDECIEMCLGMRKVIQRELLRYCQKKHFDSSIRLGNMLSLLPTLQRAARRFHEDMTLSNVLNAYSVDQTFYELVNF